MSMATFYNSIIYSSKEEDMGWKGQEIIYGTALPRRILFPGYGWGIFAIFM